MQDPIGGYKRERERTHDRWEKDKRHSENISIVKAQLEFNKIILIATSLIAFTGVYYFLDKVIELTPNLKVIAILSWLEVIILLFILFLAIQLIGMLYKMFFGKKK